jgi:hypothetical protein
MKKYLALSGLLLVTSVMSQEPQGKKSSDYYMMKNNHVLHFLSTGEVETVMSNATLANGIVISANGEMAGKNSIKNKLENGECIDVDGVMQPCSMLDSILTRNVRSKEKE